MIVAARPQEPFVSVDDLWRRARVRTVCLVQLAEADAFRPSLGLAPRQALWAIKALRDEPLTLFAAASTREAMVPELDEPAVPLRPMTAGGEVVEDYERVGLTLRAHPVSFLRDDLAQCRIVSCATAMQARDGQWLEAAGLVLVRQRPGSAKGVMFITVEDETGIANLVIWPQVLEKNRRVFSGPSCYRSAAAFNARATSFIWSLDFSRTCRQTLPASANAILGSGSLMAAAMNSIMTARRPLRAACGQGVRMRATSTSPTCI